MVPSTIVVLESMPINPAGKVARQALPEPGRSRPALAEPFVAPRTPAEARLAAIWADVLGLETVGVNDRFLDLGGTSLSAMQVITRVQSAFAVLVDYGTLLGAPTVAEMTLALVGDLADPAAFERLLAQMERPAGE
jgi:acyl carrier protein